MSGFGAGVTGLSGIIALINKLLDLFKKTPAQIQQDRQDSIGDTHADVEKGSKGDFSGMDNLP